MVDEDGFGLTPHHVKMKKKNQAYQDRHLQPIGENVEVMRHSETIHVEFRYFSTPVAGETRNPVPLLYELVKLKQKPGFMSFLRDNDVFMNMHVFETYAISTVGHVSR
jgi:hypothetical protein